MIIGKIIKYIEKHIDDIFKIIYGSKKDELGYLYNGEYNHEMYEFKRNIENELYILEKSGVIFGANEVYQCFVTNWFDSDIFNNINISNNIKVFIHEMLHSIYYTEQNNSELKLNYDDSNCIKELIFHKICDIEKYLCNLKSDNNNIDKIIYDSIKNHDNKQSGDILQHNINKYIQLNNILYKLYKYKNDNELFYIVCREYNIDRNKFVF